MPDPATRVDGGAAQVATAPAVRDFFAQVAETVHGADEARSALQRIVALIPQHLPAVEHVGVTVVRRGRPTTVAASGPVPAQVDELQYRTGEGPCLDALLTNASYRTGDLAAEQRWPAFSRLCVDETPVRSVMAFQLPVDDQTVAALNCYADEQDAFADDEVVALGGVFAAHTALAFAALQSQEQAHNLTVALDSSRLIGAAVGILMAQHRLTQDQAFDLLREASQRTHRKLRDLAEDVVRTGDLG